MRPGMTRVDPQRGGFYEYRGYVIRKRLRGTWTPTWQVWNNAMTVKEATFETLRDAADYVDRRKGVVT